jgi:hypothetical protein
MSPIFKLDLKDLLKGLVVSVLAAVFAAMGTMISNQGFALDGAALRTIAAVAVTSALGYLSKQLLTTEDGKLMGKL